MQSIQPKHSDFRGYPDTIKERTYTKTQGFQRNNCGSGQVGSVVNYSKTYTVTGTKEDLDNAVAADSAVFNTEGQANANSNGTCSTTCVKQYVNIPSNALPYYKNGGTRFYRYEGRVGIEGVVSPYTIRTNKEDYHSSFTKTVLYSTTSTPEIASNVAMVYGAKIKSTTEVDIWQNFSVGTGTTNCSIGEFYVSLPDKAIYSKPVSYIATTGFKSGVASIVRRNYYYLDVYFTDNNNDHTLLGSIAQKTDNYNFKVPIGNYFGGEGMGIKCSITSDIQGRLYIAIMIGRYGHLGKRGNLGVWYSDFPRAPFTPVFQNIYPWNYSSSYPKLIDIQGRTNGQGAILVYSESKVNNNDYTLKSIGINTGGIGNSSSIYNSSAAVQTSLCGDIVDNRIYLFIGTGGSYRAFNWTTGTWQTL